jgi:Fe2+ or Zn2+ uptake regulation protein
VRNIADDQIHDLVSSRLRQTELRYTTSRRAIVAVLSQSDRPLTLPEILAADTSLSQSSAYRNLGELTTAGVVHRIVVGDSFAHYELAEDLTGPPNF